MGAEGKEFGVPVIFDVTAHTREAAGEALVEILAGHKVPGNSVLLDEEGQATVESWWTLEAIDKKHDRNDNGAGVVVFAGDLDYLLAVLRKAESVVVGIEAEKTRRRLLSYFAPEHRTGWADDETVGT